MYSPVFVAKVSAAAHNPRNRHRVALSPRRSRPRHLRRSFRTDRASPFDASRISPDLLDQCINTSGTRKRAPAISGSDSHSSSCARSEWATLFATCPCLPRSPPWSWSPLSPRVPHVLQSSLLLSRRITRTAVPTFTSCLPATS